MMDKDQIGGIIGAILFFAVIGWIIYDSVAISKCRDNIGKTLCEDNGLDYLGNSGGSFLASKFIIATCLENNKPTNFYFNAEQNKRCY